MKASGIWICLSVILLSVTILGFGCASNAVRSQNDALTKENAQLKALLIDCKFDKDHKSRPIRHDFKCSCEGSNVYFDDSEVPIYQGSLADSLLFNEFMGMGIRTTWWDCSSDRFVALESWLEVMKYYCMQLRWTKN